MRYSDKNSKDTDTEFTARWLTKPQSLPEMKSETRFAQMDPRELFKCMIVFEPLRR